jgi:hypothetical protein
VSIGLDLGQTSHQDRYVFRRGPIRTQGSSAPALEPDPLAEMRQDLSNGPEAAAEFPAERLRRSVVATPSSPDSPSQL